MYPFKSIFPLGSTIIRLLLLLCSLPFVSYRSGYDAALTMINTCGDSVQVQDFILEFMATNYQIELKDGKDAASNHRKGFEDAVRETDPALASSIF